MTDKKEYMRRLIIADVKSINRKGKSSGHYFSLAENYKELYGDTCKVKVGGGPVYLTHFKENDMFVLPYDSKDGENKLLQVWLTLMNCRYLFRHTTADDVIVMLHSAVATFMAGIALFAKKDSNIYVITYDTVAISRPFEWLKRMIFHFAKQHIKGFLCSNEKVAKRYGLPYCIIPDYIYPYFASDVKPISYAMKKYDFVMVGSIWPDKGVLEAVKQLAKTPYKVLVAGKPSNEHLGKAIEDVCEHAENIELQLGFVSDKDYHRYIMEARYCMFNYQGVYAERSSGVILDVLFNGTPVVGHSCNATQFVGDNGLGFLFDDITKFNPQSVMSKEQQEKYVHVIARYLKKQEVLKCKVVNFLQLKKQESDWLE